MDILRTIKERRSTVAFKSEEIALATLKEIFTYGSFAPSHYMTESWRIKLFQGKGKKKLVEAIIKSYQRIGMLPADDSEKARRTRDSIGGFLLTIPHHALIYYEMPTELIRNEEEYASISAFIQNSQLAAWEYGVGMLWTIAPYMHDEQFYEEVGLQQGRHKITAVMQIGYPEKVTRKKPRTPVEKWLEVIE